MLSEGPHWHCVNKNCMISFLNLHIGIVLLVTTLTQTIQENSTGGHVGGSVQTLHKLAGIVAVEHERECEWKWWAVTD